MSGHIVCPHCGKHLAKGSTFCIHCGNRVPENLRQLTTPSDSLTWEEPEVKAGTSTGEEESVTLPEPDDLDLTPEPQ
jgi:predicted amidophosphoribosyltransferase